MSGSAFELMIVSLLMLLISGAPLCQSLLHVLPINDL